MPFEFRAKRRRFHSVDRNDETDRQVFGVPKYRSGLPRRTPDLRTRHLFGMRERGCETTSTTTEAAAVAKKKKRIEEVYRRIGSKRFHHLLTKDEQARSSWEHSRDAGTHGAVARGTSHVAGLSLSLSLALPLSLARSTVPLACVRARAGNGNACERPAFGRSASRLPARGAAKKPYDDLITPAMLSSCPCHYLCY